MVITDREISILRDIPGSGVIRCEGCGELIVGQCTGGCMEFDDETPKLVGVHRFFAPCEHCGEKNETFE